MSRRVISGAMGGRRDSGTTRSARKGRVGGASVSANGGRREEWRNLSMLNQSRLEQDEAAGGHERRLAALPNGKCVTVSVAVRVFPPGREHYAYMQFKSGGRTTTRYIGNATAESRAGSLRKGWRLLRQKKTLEAEPAKWLRS